MNAIATATSGAAPTTTDVRDAPTLRIANVNRSCESPGASSPASRYGQASTTSCGPATSAATTATASATVTVARVASRRVALAREAEPHGDGHRRRRARRT